MAPGALQYYAIEILPSAKPQTSAMRVMAEGGNSVRSNVVYAGNAANIDYVTDLRIVSLHGNTTLTEEAPVAYLYAEVLPVSAAYQRVEWRIIEGDELASVNAYGVVVARTNTNGGYVTVEASATDGSGAMATLQLWVEPISASGVDDVSAGNDIDLHVYPQPVSDVLYVSSARPIERIWLYDLQGAAVKAVSQRGIDRLEVGGLPAGLYILRVKTVSGGEAVAKVLKK